MIREQDQRTALLIGEQEMQRLREAHVVVIGLGGVGGYALEALVRAGVGYITLVDFDRVQVSNINRQIIATHETVGRFKTELFAQRALQINPDLIIKVHNLFLDSSNLKRCLEDAYFVLDAIDSVPSKVALLEYCHRRKLRVVSVFGAGRRLDPSRIRSGDISKTNMCPLARSVRKALRERGINKGIRAVWSEEEALTPHDIEPDKPEDSQAKTIGSISYMPGIMGLWAASELIRFIRSECIHIPF